MVGVDSDSRVGGSIEPCVEVVDVRVRFRGFNLAAA